MVAGAGDFAAEHLDATIVAKEHLDELDWYFFQSAYCAVRDPGALQDGQAETTGRRVRITEDVPVLRVDHISAKTMLLGVWQVSYNGEYDPDSGEIESRLSPP
jgi:hypothetical protein